MKQFWRWSLLPQTLLWMALAVVAYATAGPYKFASCWPIIPAYIPPVGFLFLAIAAYSSVVLLVSAFRRQLRGTQVLAASHGMILTIGMVACIRGRACGSRSCKLPLNAQWPLLALVRPNISGSLVGPSSEETECPTQS
jgi:hypothetical protein